MAVKILLKKSVDKKSDGKIITKKKHTAKNKKAGKKHTKKSDCWNSDG